jgi:radical SAM-linked protein
MFRQRIRINYSVGGRQRFLSHRDMMRAMIRALRRTALPLRLSEGFHVRPKVSFALARGVGIASDAEYMEFELTDWVDTAHIRRSLAEQMPQGLQLRDLRAVYPDQRAIVAEVTYRIDLSQRPPGVEDRIAEILASETVEVARGGDQRHEPRHVNIRPLMLDLRLEPDGSLLLRASASDDGTLRAEEVLALLGMSKEAVASSFIKRTSVVLADQRE